eukprot:CAMPEP_0117609212 /NCGR_PEP_ID=MMETSP0784-20121206/81210_1 /TAXON_ID=39447 /ORGANISM="" /LENGTH=268 /DNA_ID=CAMNT_0005412515 /DNA_START=25 /DNA_END=827 /DNA_ORIENTATION=+
MTGVPIQVLLAEDFSSFGDAEKKRLADAVASYWQLPETAFVVDRVTPGSVVVDAHLVVAERLKNKIVDAFDEEALTQHVRNARFAVVYATIPGLCTARRVLQWATATSVAEKLCGKDAGATGPALDVEALAGGAVGMTDAWAARQALADMKAVAAFSNESRLHRSLQLCEAHARAFPTCPTLHASLRAYDAPALRAGGAKLGKPADGGAPPSVDCIGVAESGHDNLLITFEGVGAEWQKQEICHRVIAIEAFNTSRAFAVVEVPGAEG